MRKFLARSLGVILLGALFTLCSTGKGGWLGALAIFAVVGVFAFLVMWAVENWNG